MNIESSPCSTGDYGLSCEWWMAHYTSTLLQAQRQTLSLSLSSLSVYRSKHSLRIMMLQVLDIKGQITHWSDFAKKHTGLPWREMWSSTVGSDHMPINQATSTTMCSSHKPWKMVAVGVLEANRIL